MPGMHIGVLLMFMSKDNIFHMILIVLLTVLVLLTRFMLLLTTAGLLPGFQLLICTIICTTVKSAVFITLSAGASFGKTRTMTFNALRYNAS